MQQICAAADDRPVTGQKTTTDRLITFYSAMALLIAAACHDGRSLVYRVVARASFHFDRQLSEVEDEYKPSTVIDGRDPLLPSAGWSALTEGFS